MRHITLSALSLILVTGAWVCMLVVVTLFFFGPENALVRETRKYNDEWSESRIVDGSTYSVVISASLVTLFAVTIVFTALSSGSAAKAMQLEYLTLAEHQEPRASEILARPAVQAKLLADPRPMRPVRTWAKRFFSLFASLLRHDLFFTFVLATIAFFIIAMCCVWTVLGLFVEPARSLPFAVGTFAVTTHAFARWKSLQRSYERLVARMRKGMLEINQFVQAGIRAGVDLAHGPLDDAVAMADAVETVRSAASSRPGSALRTTVPDAGETAGIRATARASAQRTVSDVVDNSLDNAEAAARRGVSEVVAEQLGVNAAGQAAIGDAVQSILDTELMPAHKVVEFVEFYGVSQITIVAMVVYSVLIAVFLLVFLILGLYAFADPENAIDGIVAALGTIVTTTSVHLSQAADNESWVDSHLASLLRIYWRRQTKRNSLETIAPSATIQDAVQVRKRIKAKME